MFCPITSRLRPPDIASWIHLDHRRDSVLKWAAHHGFFGISLRTSPVKWIRLSRPGNITSSSTPTCIICTRTFSNKSHLTRHMKNIHPDHTSTHFVIGLPQNCTRCTLQFNSKTELDLHIATSHGCPHCQKRFSDIANMYLLGFSVLPSTPEGTRRVPGAESLSGGHCVVVMRAMSPL